MNGQDVVNEARGLLGIPYHHQGRSMAGIDCIGVIIVVAWNLGLSDYDFDGYAEIPDGKTLMEEAGKNMTRINARDMRVGDVLVMRFRRDPQHFAILTDKGIIHATWRAGAVVETTLGDKWRDRILAVYRLPGVDSVAK